MKIRSNFFNYIQLMKPAIMLLVLLTGSAALVLEKSLLLMPWPVGAIHFLLVLLGLMLTGGSANAFNMYLERQIDGRMARTKDRRPLPLRKIRPQDALIFAIIIGALGVLLFVIFFNLLSALLSLATILFYSFFYTIFLKPRTPYNIVVGGIAGAMAPIIGWAAVSGSFAVTPFILFAIIFLWTPPHFWALAIHHEDDYRLVKYPMMPISRGVKGTRLQILFYVIGLVLVSGLCLRVGSGSVYAILAVIMGGIFVLKSAQFVVSKSDDKAYGLFRFSIAYLLVLFSGLIVDGTLKFFHN